MVEEGFTLKYYLAIDIGASSGRHILGHVENGRMVLEEIYRFDNLQVHRNGHDCWDMENLWNGIIGGLKACGELGKIPATVGIDTWGVDYVLLDENDKVLGDAVAYRDSRNEGMDNVVSKYISAEALYTRTGIQKQPFLIEECDHAKPPISSSSSCHMVRTASEGIFQPHRGDTLIEPTAGPSGKQLRLNCWVKNRR